MDQETLRSCYSKNYTEMLKLRKVLKLKDSSKDHYVESRDAHGKKTDFNPMDDFDKKRFKEGRLAFIGVQPRVDSNRMLTKEQKELLDKKRIQDKRMARGLA